MWNSIDWILNSYQQVGLPLNSWFSSFGSFTKSFRDFVGCLTLLLFFKFLFRNLLIDFNLAWVLLLTNVPLLSTVSITVVLGSYLIISFSTIFAMVSFLFKISWYKFSISTFFSVIFSSIISLTLFKHLITTSVKIYPKLIFSLVHFL